MVSWEGERIFLAWVRREALYLLVPTDGFSRPNKNWYSVTIYNWHCKTQFLIWIISEYFSITNPCFLPFNFKLVLSHFLFVFFLFDFPKLALEQEEPHNFQKSLPLCMWRLRCAILLGKLTPMGFECGPWWGREDVASLWFLKDGMLNLSRKVAPT